MSIQCEMKTLYEMKTTTTICKLGPISNVGQGRGYRLSNVSTKFSYTSLRQVIEMALRCTRATRGVTTPTTTITEAVGTRRVVAIWAAAAPVIWAVLAAAAAAVAV